MVLMLQYAALSILLLASPSGSMLVLESGRESSAGGCPPSGDSSAAARARCSGTSRPQARAMVRPTGRDSMRANSAARESCAVSGLQEMMKQNSPM